MTSAAVARHGLTVDDALVATVEASVQRTSRQTFSASYSEELGALVSDQILQEGGTSPHARCPAYFRERPSNSPRCAQMRQYNP